MRALCSLFGLVVLCVTTVARAQTPAEPLQQRQLTPVDAEVEDLGPLSATLRRVDLGLSPSNGFVDVFRDPRRSDTLIRHSGGLYAAFPRSVYTPTEKGDIVDIPPGTTFYIGRLPSDVDAQPGGDPSRPPELPASSTTSDTEVLPQSQTTVIEPQAPTSSRIDRRRDTRISALRVEDDEDANNNNPLGSWRPMGDPADIKHAPGPAFLTNLNYRAARVHDMLKQAAQAEAARTSDIDPITNPPGK